MPRSRLAGSLAQDATFSSASLSATDIALPKYIQVRFVEWWRLGGGNPCKHFSFPNQPKNHTRRLDTMYQKTREARLRTRAQIVFLAIEQKRTAPAIAAMVRTDDQTVRRWRKRWMAEGMEGRKDRPMPSSPQKITEASKEPLLATVRRRPRSLDQPYAMWTLQRLADDMAEHTGIRASYETVRLLLKAGDMVLSRPQQTVSSPDPEYQLKKRRWKKRETGERRKTCVLSADECNLRWLPTLRAMWSPKGQQVEIPMPTQPDTSYGISAVNAHNGETIVHFQLHKRRREIGPFP